MTTFSRVEDGARPPYRTLIVPPTAFADDWDQKPKDAVCCGLRLISSGDTVIARAEAAKAAWAAHPHEHDSEARIESYNDALMRWVVARGTCDPNNTREPWEIWKGMPELMVQQALTPLGARFIFDAIQLLATETSPTVPALERKRIDDLIVDFELNFDALTPAKQAHVLQLLGAAHEILTT